MVEEKDWFSQMREKNKDLTIKNKNQDNKVIITDFLLVKDLKSGKTKQVCRTRK